MTEALFRDDAYLRDCDATVVAVDDEGVVLDRTVFYPLGGGQPGDTGQLDWDGGTATVVDTRYGSDGAIRHVLAPDSAAPAPGTQVRAAIDWARRYRHMRMHTAMHLLGAVLPHGVTGGNISTEKSRLDFDMEETVDKDAVAAALAELVAADHPVGCRWISDQELDEQPELVRTMKVAPPRGQGRVRLLEIEGIDLQPCGGTHVASTAEVGTVRIGKVEKKGRHNRRVNIHLDD
ncbi:MAG: alanyl-tRNA editing protein [Woeseiaceae bacterium]|nr:alanyl-tRNA editing protein [Woeseiaceae bacterium]